MRKSKVLLVFALFLVACQPVLSLREAANEVAHQAAKLATKYENEGGILPSDDLQLKRLTLKATGCVLANSQSQALPVDPATRADALWQARSQIRTFESHQPRFTLGVYIGEGRITIAWLDCKDKKH